MQTISFKLEVFEGPMDLLLNLISKHKLNIYDIEISSLLEQYLAYLDQCREQDLELAGEFLEMAARLIYIKTASLLPRPEDAQKEKQALQGALIEYALCKQAAQALAQRFVGGQIFTPSADAGGSFSGIRQNPPALCAAGNMEHHGAETLCPAGKRPRTVTACSDASGGVGDVQGGLRDAKGVSR